MGLRLASFLRQARLACYRDATTPEFRAVVALARVYHDADRLSGRKTARRHVRAYSASMLTQAVNAMLDRERVDERLMAEGHEPIPKIDWGRIIMTHAKKYARVINVDLDDFVGELFADMLEGRRRDTIRQTGDWRNNLIGEIEEWGRAGYSKRQMEGSLANFVKNKSSNMLRTKQLRVNPDAGFESGEAPSEGASGSGRLFESLFTLDGITKSMMGNWMSLSRRNPVLTDLVRTISDKLGKRDDDYAFIFDAYIQDPSASLNELQMIVINGRDPNTGERGRMPLWQALGFDDPVDSKTRNTNKAKLSYRIKNMRKVLHSMFPEIESVLRDMQFR